MTFISNLLDSSVILQHDLNEILEILDRVLPVPGGHYGAVYSVIHVRIVTVPTPARIIMIKSTIKVPIHHPRPFIVYRQNILRHDLHPPASG
jgi:hypothetical protein